MKNVAVGAGTGAALMAIVMTTIVPKIEDLEGIRTRAYRDIGGVLTVCAGHTGPDVVVGKVYKPEECSALTQKDAEKAASGVLKTSPHLIFHPMILAAAISISYNIGIAAYAKSSIASNFNTGNFSAGCSAMLKYTYVNKKFSPGLLNRRNQEYAICTSTLTPEGLKNVSTST